MAVPDAGLGVTSTLSEDRKSSGYGFVQTRFFCANRGSMLFARLGKLIGPVAVRAGTLDDVRCGLLVMNAGAFEDAGGEDP